jgi:hypothetical protein
MLIVFMLNVTNNPFMLSVVLLNVVLLSVVAPRLQGWYSYTYLRTSYNDFLDNYNFLSYYFLVCLG